MGCHKRTCARECFYCESQVQRHDHDHAPIPARAGGTVTVVACPGCHNLKDRILFVRWPIVLTVLAVRELVDLGELPTAETAREWPLHWDSMSTHARLLWAKWAQVLLGGGDIGTRLDLDARR